MVCIFECQRPSKTPMMTSHVHLPDRSVTILHQGPLLVIGGRVSSMDISCECSFETIREMVITGMDDSGTEACSASINEAETKWALTWPTS
jgi:hypothetical protein